MIKHTLTAALAGLMLTAGTVRAENVEIYLVDMLDNTQNGYCLDISGGQGPQADPANGLQGHTCYSPSGQHFVDQTFETDRFAEGVLYMPDFDVCAEVAGTDAGSAIGLAACNGSDPQNFAFSGEGTITPVTAPEMCLTVGEDTRSGRSETNQIKTLTLETCDDDLTAFQIWTVRTAE